MRRSRPATVGRGLHPSCSARLRWFVDFIARSVHGVEWVAADEIAESLPESGPLRLSRREIRFRLPGTDRRLLDLRTVDDVFLAVGRLPEVGTTKAALPPLSAGLARLPWAEALTTLGELRELPRRPQFDVVASLEGKRSYNRFAVENAAGAAITAQLPGATYLERTADGRAEGRPDVTVRLFLRGTEAVAAVRLGDAPLHRRPWKQDTGPGTLHAPMAAAMVRVAGPAGSALLDPFCGDGTIAIEAALAGAGPVVAADLDPVRLAGTGRNAQRAGVTVELALADAGRPPWRPHAFDAVITNPPWGLAVEARGDLAGAPSRHWQLLPGLLAPDAAGCLLVDAELSRPGGRNGSADPLARVRLAGRVSEMLAYTPPGAIRRPLSPGLAGWRKRAITAGVITEDGF
jgi:tRNA (guanine6-N2)-methyltransferase